MMSHRVCEPQRCMVTPQKVIDWFVCAIRCAPAVVYDSESVVQSLALTVASMFKVHGLVQQQ